MEHEESNEITPLKSSPQPEKKRPRLNKWHIITVVLVLIIGIQVVLYFSLNARYNSLETEHRALISEHQNLNNNYTTLEGSYDSLKSSYDLLELSHSNLQSTYDSYVSDYSNLRNEVNQRTLQLDNKAFITPNDQAVKNLVFQVTGGWSNPNDSNEYWSDVKAMYDWVVNNIKYRSDGLCPVLPSAPSGSVEYRQDMWQFSSETLNLKQGDCEDMAILLTSMILSYNGGKYWVECIETAGSLGGHVGVQVPVSGDKLTLLDPAGNYFTQTLYGGIGSKDISTEISNWLTYWGPTLGSDVRVERVFSNSLDKSFSSTSEYTSWMYNR